jgi:hypothetical protein
MEKQIEAVFEKLTPEESHVVLRYAEFLLQQRQVEIDARTARRKVSQWLVRDVGNLLMGGAPELIPGDLPVWRVPVLVTRGRRGRASYVDVDARAGDLLITEDTPQRVLADVRAFVAGSASN